MILISFSASCLFPIFLSIKARSNWKSIRQTPRQTRISKQGNQYICRILHRPALNVVRYEVSPFIQLFHRTIEKHHQKMKSYVAVQKKILVISILWKADKSFDENYRQQVTGDVELGHPLGSASQKLSNISKINSSEINQGYTRCTTVEVSPFAPSRA